VEIEITGLLCCCCKDSLDLGIPIQIVHGSIGKVTIRMLWYICH